MGFKQSSVGKIHTLPIDLMLAWWCYNCKISGFQLEAVPEHLGNSTFVVRSGTGDGVSNTTVYEGWTLNTGGRKFLDQKSSLMVSGGNITNFAMNSRFSMGWKGSWLEINHFELCTYEIDNHGLFNNTDPGNIQSILLLSGRSVQDKTRSRSTGLLWCLMKRALML
jgi:hypothetical protein